MPVTTHMVLSTDNGMRLDRWLKTHYDLPFVQVQKRCRKGEIRIDGKRVKGKEILTTGMYVRIPPLYDVPVFKPHSQAYNPQDAVYIKDLVIYKDDDIIALNKPVGIAVQGGVNTPRHIDGLTRYLHRDTQAKPRLVHRLDKDTSGVLLLARNRQSATHLGRAFKYNTLQKIYWAIVVGTPAPSAGIINAPMLKKRIGTTEKIAVDKNGKRAITEYEVLQRIGGVLSLVALYPRTGRTHQLRVHMAYMQTPILGDGKYGGKSAFVSGESHMKKMHLHARSIYIDGIRVTADISPHFKDTVKMFSVDILPHYDTVFMDGKPCV